MREQKLRILSVSAHPHDWTWFSGTLGKHVEKGDKVTVCIVTHGGSTHREELLDELNKPKDEHNPDIINEPVEQYIEKKAAEMKEAAGLFGITDIRLLNFPDKPFRIEQYPTAIDSITDLILDIRPHVLITENPFTSHGIGKWSDSHRDDHTEVGMAAMEAKDRAELPRQGAKPTHRIPTTFWPSLRGDFDFAIELSDELFEKRVKAEMLYESQGHTEGWARRRMELELGHTGFVMATRYAESFARAKTELLTHLPVPELMIQQSQQSIIKQHYQVSDKNTRGNAL